MQDYVTNYEEAVDYIYRIPRFNSNYSLQNIEHILTLMGQPDNSMQIVHIAGTNGKGSVSAYLAELLRETGLKVGMFTSPHLVDMRERFCINGEMISKELFVEAIQYVQFFLNSEEVTRSEQLKAYKPCFFDILFIAGMFAFYKEHVDILILETGLGGRLDATNAVKNKVLTLIAHIGLDHTEQLGNTIEEIAAEKAGIMKKGVPCVVGAGNEAVNTVFLQRAEMLGSTCRILNGEDYGCQRVSEKSVAFSYFSSYYGTVQIKLNTAALYQADNASLALAGLEALIAQGIVRMEDLSTAQLQKSLYNTFWAGRMEEIRPNVFLDGAHNPDGIRALLSSIKKDGCKGKRLLIFSAVSDKNYQKMLTDISHSGLFSLVCVTQLEGERGVEARVLYGALSGIQCEAVCIPDLSEAIRHFLTKQQHLDYIYIIGSLYLVGQAQKLLSNHEKFPGEQKGALV